MDNETANLTLIVSHLQTLSTSVEETRRAVLNIPEQIDKAFERHEQGCTARQGFTDLKAKVAEDSVVVNVVKGDLTTRQRKENARATGGQAAVKKGFALNIPPAYIKWAIGALVAAALSAAGVKVGSEVVSDPGGAVAGQDVDSDQPANLSVARP